MLQEGKLALDSLKVALDIGSLLIKSDAALDKAILKIELEKMIDSLVETKHIVRELDNQLYQKEIEIEGLKEQLKNQRSTVGYLGARYFINDKNEPTGTAYCPTCWAIKKELLPLSAWSMNELTHKCGGCGNIVKSRMSPLNVDSYIKSNRASAEKVGGEFTLDTY